MSRVESQGGRRIIVGDGRGWTSSGGWVVVLREEAVWFLDDDGGS